MDNKRDHAGPAPAIGTLDPMGLAAAVNQAGQGIVITDNRGDILYVNPGFEAMTGYTAREVLGQNPRLLKSGRQDPAYYRALWSTITAGRTWHGHLINRRKNGSFYIEEMTVTPVLDSTGRIVRYIAVKQDVTERRQAEETGRFVAAASASESVPRNAECSHVPPNNPLGDSPATASSTPAFDEAALIERLMGDREVATAVVGGFLDDMPRQLAALAMHLSAHDMPAVERQAHRINGTAASVSAEALREAALHLEAAARVGDTAALGARLGDLERQFQAAQQAMRNILV